MATPAARMNARADTDAVELISESRDRAGRRLGGRDFWVSIVVAASFVAVAVPLAVLAPTERSPSLLLLGALVASYAFASRVHFEIGIGFAVPTQLIFVPMLFLAPPALAPLLVVLALLLGGVPENLRGQWHLGRSVVLVSNGWHALGPALVLVAAGEPPADWHSNWPVFAAALAAQFAFDLLSSTARGLALGVSVRPHLPAVGLAYLVDLALAPIALALAYAAREREFAFLLAVPLLGLFAFFARERRSRIDHAVELGQAYRGTAFLLGDVVEADDAYTGSHSRDVVELVLSVADELGIDPRERRKAEFAALLHDVGKIRIPGEIINKAGPLDDDDWVLMRTHTTEGERMLKRIGGLLAEVGTIVRSCHERWDGGGYPDGLAGEEIPRVARIVFTCDAFNAMTTTRSYRKAISVEEAVAELRRCAGSQFDPLVVDALVRVVERPPQNQGVPAHVDEPLEGPVSVAVEDEASRSSRLDPANQARARASSGSIV
jgi:putative nucleotidyltransferase with HDIG domain